MSNINISSNEKREWRREVLCFTPRQPIITEEIAAIFVTLRNRDINVDLRIKCYILKIFPRGEELYCLSERETQCEQIEITGPRVIANQRPFLGQLTNKRRGVRVQKSCLTDAQSLLSVGREFII